MYPIDQPLKEFIESGVATLVGTGDNGGRPQIAFGWGPRVLDAEGVVEVFLDSARADKTLANLRANGRIAMTLAHPVNYRSVQFKGVFKEAGDPDQEDVEYVRQRREDFVTSTSLIGDPPDIIRAMWLDDLVSVTFEVEHAFDQTPGPNAGQPL
jgi:pyridoxamine 5'-phosphate oxidase-like protein